MAELETQPGAGTGPEPAPERPPGMIAREVSALQTLEALAADRAREEADVERRFRLRRDDEEKAYQAARNRVVTVARADNTDTKAKYQAAREQIETRARTETAKVEAEFAEAKKAATSKAASGRNGAKKRMEETRWQALAVFEAGKDGAIKQFKQHETELAAASADLDDFKALAEPSLRRVRRFAPKPAAEGAENPAAPAEVPIEALRGVIATARERLVPVEKLFLPKFLAPSAFVWPWLLLAGGMAYPLGTAIGWGPGVGVAVGVAVAAAVGAYLALAGLAKSSVAKVYPPFVATTAEADRLAEQGKKWTKDTFEKAKADVETKRQADVAKAEERFNQVVADHEAKREQALREADETYPPRVKAAADRREAELKQADEFFPKRLTEIQERFGRDTAAADQKYAGQKEATTRALAEAWQALESRWRDGLARVDEVVTSVNREADAVFLDWHGADLDAWRPPAAAPDGMRFGGLTLDLAGIPQGLPTDPRLRRHGPTRHDFPALLPFPRTGSVLVKTTEAGRADAVSLLQSLMLRYMSSVPPGKVRFTIIDPVGLGENFAAFMHLSDYSELLVTSRIWTETPHIDQRLADLSAHMENVIQKYLRNEFETIEEYNAFAGEVAEPFRILVVANFPTSFSESAARRLVSIASTGARCGVYTLISLDMKQNLPAGVQLKELESHCVNFLWRDGKLHWKDNALGKLPLAYDAPPSPERFTKLMHKLGELARNANRVEVPFEFIAPTPDKYWTGDTRAGVDVPLGRAGATKLQHLKLGKGTSQHALTAGKTGSGKSTLLHALITNAALRYSPDELELYLIDFKKGVEFKVYAAMELPHARVIAVESEREFGLSVLQRLDAELKARGDRFRDLGVQDLNGYREAPGENPPLPRVLFIVDEFQEFFVEDDKLAQEVALLLDRLVRQGRAFGIHVILGSQSLGGAYSLARSTIGQMAVRIALQCSEADAHLILSEENSAARLLTRPGEAIYNDANGMVEGNNFFQVVWLGDDRREAYLKAIRDLARARNRPPAAQIVFEGNLPAVASKNHLLAGLLQAPAWPEPPKADFAWLGEAIAIKDPTASIFRPQSGANLLIVGQNDEMALGIETMAVVSLAAQYEPHAARFFLLDGSPADNPLSGRLAKLKDVVPHEVREVAARDLPAALGEIAAEVERRQKDSVVDAPAIYLLIFDLQRFRDLRKSDDDFGFSRYGDEPKAAPPSKLFGNILRDGPPTGVHTVVWCDSVNNLNRTFERQSLREFEMRVLFQMSGNDSSTLIDTPVATRLGPNRALYFSEEEGRLEKFRPYGLPTDDWYAEVRARFDARPRPAPANGHAGHEPVAAEAGEV